MIFPVKGWNKAYHLKIGHSFLQSDSEIVSSLSRAYEGLASSACPKDATDPYFFHLHSLSNRSNQIPKYAILGAKISFHYGTLCLEMILFIQTTCRLRLFFTQPRGFNSAVLLLIFH